MNNMTNLTQKELDERIIQYSPNGNFLTTVGELIDDVKESWDEDKHGPIGGYTDREILDFSFSDDDLCGYYDESDDEFEETLKDIQKQEK